jgi:two-component system sporulation sensor kinase A
VFRFAQAELQHALSMLSDIEYAINEASIVVVLNECAMIKYVNDNFCEVSQFAAEEVLDQPFHKVCGLPVYMDYQSVHAQLRQGNVWKGEIKAQTQHGSDYWLFSTVIPFQRDGNEPFQYISISHDITGQKLIEERLLKREQQLSALVNSLPDFIMYKDREGRVMESNDYTLDFLGLHDRDYRGKTLHELTRHSEHMLIGDEGNPDISDQRARQLQTPIRGEEQICSSDGICKTLDTVKVPIFHGDGSYQGIWIVGRDMTERKRMEEQIRAVKEQLESFFDHTADAIAVLDTKGIIINVNQAFMDIYGWHVDELIGLPIPTYNESFEEIQTHIQKLLDNGEALRYDTIRRRKDGERIHVNVTASPIRNSHGEIIALSAITRDVTAKILAEEEYRATKEQLESFFVNSIDAINVMDRDGHVLRVNEAFEQLYGYQTAEIIGKKVPFTAHLQEIENWRRHVLNGEAIREQEVLRYRKDGQQIYVNVTAFPIRDHDNTITAWSIISRDVSRHRETQELLRKSEKLAAVGQMAASLAHEIRNPLTAIRGFVQLIRGRSEESQYFCDITLSELDRISKIVNELLLLAKPRDAHFESKNLVEILHNVTTLLEPQGALKGVQLCSNLEESNIHVYCEPDQLKQVFINILKNGIEATPEGRRVTLEMEEDRKNNRVIVHCQDEGPGIPSAQLAKLGEPFFTTKENGTGLGLMVSYRLIANHNGNIDIHSEIGMGTTVDITLPVAQNRLLAASM